MQGVWISALYKIDPQWPASTSARQVVIPTAIDLLAKPDYCVPDVAKSLLNTIDPSWRNSEAAQATLPKLILRSVSWSGWSAATLLLEIDPNWFKREAASSVIPRLVEMLNGDGNPDAVKAALEKIDPLWSQSASGRDGHALLWSHVLRGDISSAHALAGYGDGRVASHLIRGMQMEETRQQQRTPPVCLESLKHVLETSAASVPTEDLRMIEDLPDTIDWFEHVDENAAAIARKTDFSQVKRLARLELGRR